MNLSSSLNLASETPLEKQDLRKVKTVLQMLIDHVDSAEFRQPVDWQGNQCLGLIDYPQIIVKPMDLSSVGQKLQQDQYGFMEEVLDDIQLIWDNCKNYNQAGSWIYSVADKMDKYYKKLVKNYFNHVVIPIPKPIVVTSQPVTPPPATRPSRAVSKRVETKAYLEEQLGNGSERQRLMEKLKKLNTENMGKIVEIIMDNCPKACKYVEEDYYQIILEKIDTVTLEEIKEKFLEIKETEDRLSKRLKV